MVMNIIIKNVEIKDRYFILDTLTAILKADILPYYLEQSNSFSVLSLDLLNHIFPAANYRFPQMTIVV